MRGPARLTATGGKVGFTFVSKPEMAVRIIAMQEIRPDQLPAHLRALFRTTDPLARRCFAVLDGSEPDGVILVDGANDTRWAAVMEPYDGVVFMAGRLDASMVADIFAHLRREGEVQAAMWLDDVRLDLLPPSPYDDVRMLEFTDRPIGQGLDEIVERVPPGLQLRCIDGDLIMRTMWGPDDVERLGGVSAWQASHVGYCLLDGEHILCEATVGPAAIGLREISAITTEGHRGKGYATITLARLIQDIESQGVSTYSVCEKQNAASAALARKLGYRVEKEYRCLAWNTLA